MSIETTAAIAKPVINIRLFTIRIITAVSLFAVLGKANVWLDTATNSILALGYRALLLLLPLTLLVLGRRSLSVTLLCAALGLVLLAVTSNQGMVMFAAALFAYGIAIAGYLIKSEAAQTKEGAAYNRVAMNMGSLLAGLSLLSPLLTPPLFSSVPPALSCCACQLPWARPSPPSQQRPVRCHRTAAAGATNCRGRSPASSWASSCLLCSRFFHKRSCSKSVSCQPGTA